MSLPILTTDSLNIYLAEVNRYPLMSHEEESRFAERYYKTRGVEDAHRLVTSNLRFVVKIALEYRNYGVKLSDLIQEGNVGLMVAVKKFNPFKGFRLITYAGWWIRSFIQECILKATGMVRHGSKALKKKLFYKKDRAETNAPLPVDMPPVEEHLPDISLDVALSDGKATRMDMLQDLDSDPHQTIEVRQNEAVVKKEVGYALAKLNDKERMVIQGRLLSDEPESLATLGVRLGLTRERVRQIEAVAMKKLKDTLKRSSAVRVNDGSWLTLNRH
ncbi:MAG: sigma-70 family RNA polymerase sigma factor [Deltaproteobacteria bacterium]|nr:sigma-70 family RNA polymerase sigma factor [Deltaproteobacteria bacterium]